MNGGRPAAFHERPDSAVGTAIGLIAGVGWQSRKVAASLAHSAVKELNKTRDQHWLEQHPHPLRLIA